MMIRSTSFLSRFDSFLETGIQDSCHPKTNIKAKFAQAYPPLKMLDIDLEKRELSIKRGLYFSTVYCRQKTYPKQHIQHKELEGRYART